MVDENFAALLPAPVGDTQASLRQSSPFGALSGTQILFEKVWTVWTGTKPRNLALQLDLKHELYLVVHKQS